MGLRVVQLVSVASGDATIHAETEPRRRLTRTVKWRRVADTFLAERFAPAVTLATGTLLVCLNAVRHYGPMNERENFLAEDLTWNVLQNLPPHRVLFSNHWDYWVSGSLYAQEVEDLRPDVAVLDPEGLRSEPYVEHLKRVRPKLMAPIVDEAASFTKWVRRLKKSPRMTPREAGAYYSAYYAMISALIARNAERPFFVTEWTDPRIGEGYERVPMSLAYLLTKESRYREQPFPEYRFHPWTNRVDPYAVKTAEIYTTSFLARARYQEEHGHPDEARKYGLQALSFDPGFSSDEVPDFPLHIEEQLREVLGNYRDLRERVQATEAPD